MGSSCSKSSVSLAVAIGIAAGALLLASLFISQGSDKDSASDMIPFFVIMLGSSIAIGSSRGGCCVFTKLLKKKQRDTTVEAQAAEQNPYAPDQTRPDA